MENRLYFTAPPTYITRYDFPELINVPSFSTHTYFFLGWCKGTTQTTFRQWQKRHYENCLHFLSHLSQFPQLAMKENSNQKLLSFHWNNALFLFLYLGEFFFPILHIRAPHLHLALEDSMRGFQMRIIQDAEGKWRHLSDHLVTT